MRHKSETKLAYLTLFLAVFHFFAETYAHVKWGQPTQALIVDYIWIALALFGGVYILKSEAWECGRVTRCKLGLCCWFYVA
jgi:hypothetical protein